MNQFNLTTTNIESAYSQGLLPQRNQKDLFYFESSCRCRLDNFQLSSENRRILNKTADFSFQVIDLQDFTYNLDIQKTIFKWIKELGWEFPISSVKTIFTNHIFNRLYIWTKESQIVAYSICYVGKNISHIAYVFYDPLLSHSDLPIRLPLQFVIDSHDQNLQYAYIGRFDPETKLGFYKRNLPGFEYFRDSQWVPFK